MDTPANDYKPLPTAEVVVVGGGPAGLRAAEVLAEQGWRVALYEGKPSVGRKFLVAGRGGLNLTHSENLDRFIERYEDEPARWRSLLADFGPVVLCAWAEALGVATYVGSSGRVFPQGQQAAILLRRWVARLRTLGVEFHVNHRLELLTPLPQGWRLDLQNLRTGQRCQPTSRTVVLALGGASWPQTGSDGAWADWMRALEIPVADWQPANCGFEVDWDARLLEVAEGLPLKNIAVTVGDRSVAGELLITRYGLEGGALYQLGRLLRTMQPPRLCIDFKPGIEIEQLVARVPAKFHRAVPWPELARAWKLSPAAAALLRYKFGFSEGQPVQRLAALAKRFPLQLRGPRPVGEAISSAGGVDWAAMDDNLMIAHHPGLFVAGEMMDWEAPTGGYLLQGCFATGTRAGRSAGRFLKSHARDF